MSAGDRRTDDPGGFVASVDQVVAPSLGAAGYVRAALGWVAPGTDVVAFAALADGDARTAAFGWSFAAFGDAAPDPLDVRGCARRLPFDVIAPTNDLRSWLAFPADEDARERWRMRLGAAWERAVVPHLHRWGRPDGFRDYVASRNLHLAAAWLSAVLGQSDRAIAELDHAHRTLDHPLDADFDRGRAELDTSLAAPLAAARGLGEYLERAASEGEESVVEAFRTVRGATAQSKITAPDAEHLRLQRRQAVIAEVCRRFVTG